MKNSKLLWLWVIWLCCVLFAGCNCKVNVDNVDSLPKNEESYAEYLQFCLDNWGEYSRVYNQEETYGECMFPSGVGCRDDMVFDYCDFEPDLDNIDTEEKRLSGCEENVQWWMKDFVEWAENIVVEWGDESEGWASFVRNGVVSYTQDWANWKMNVECIADFVDGSLGVSYSDAELEN